jgi:hypothetical protein
LFEAQSFVTAFLAADDGVEETYNPCSLPPLSITTVKWRFITEEDFFGLPPNYGIYILFKYK